MYDPGGHTYDVSVRFFLCRVFINSSRGDTLRYEWLLVCCYHLIVCSVYCCWLEDEDGYGYVYHDDYCITLLVKLTLPTFCLVMHVIGYRSKHITCLIKMVKIMKVKDHLIVAVSLALSNLSALHV
jgi:hypothetical protein